MSEAPTRDELLAAHAAGHLPAPVSLIVATHLALSPLSRRRYRQLEAVGGALLETLEPAPLAEDAWSRLCTRLDVLPQEEMPAPPKLPMMSPPASRIPRPLRDLLPAPLDKLHWHHEGPAAAVELDGGDPGYRTSLIRVCAGQPFPQHSHSGLELILVLEGGFRDGSNRYVRGDLQIAGPDVEHRPVAEKGEDWLWLRVLDAPLRGGQGHSRLLDPFHHP
jgi:putative transcriptional regulator